MKPLAFLLAITSVMIAAWFAPAGATRVQAMPRAADAANGAALFQQYDCAKCHQADANGGLGPDGEEAPKIAGTRLSYDDFIAQIRMPVDRMQAFPDMGDADGQDLYAYLKTLP